MRDGYLMSKRERSSEPIKLPGKAVHGTASSYNNYGCGCPECSDAWSAYMYDRVKKWREKKRKEKVEAEKSGVQIKNF
jgi:hypothetical protein